jgi:AbrB family looped-hinge helix DNA binding protein
MKTNLSKKIQKRMTAKDKFYGTTTMGARGQVVIPAQARKELSLAAGDQLVVMGKFGKVLGLMKTEQMAEFVETIMKNLSGTGMEEEFKKHFDSTFGKPLSRKQ